MAIKGLEWVGSRRLAHVVVGFMIFFVSLVFLKKGPEISMLLVTIAGISWEYFNKYQHKIGFRKNIFDNYGVISTMMGGAIAVTLLGIISLVKLLIV